MAKYRYVELLIQFFDFLKIYFCKQLYSVKYYSCNLTVQNNHMKNLFILLLIFISFYCREHKEQKMQVDVYYFDGCPTYQKTIENLKDALNELNLQYTFRVIKVSDAEDAVNKKFLGSPTIRINGVDLEEKDKEYIFGCRLYYIDNKMIGTPTKEFITKKLSILLKKLNLQN